jgi:DUF917 family protein
MGCVAKTALYPLSGRQLTQAMIPGTISLAEQLGRLIRQARAAHGDPISAILCRLGGYRLFDGKIIASDQGIALVSPRAFSYNLDYIPVEERFA